MNDDDKKTLSDHLGENRPIDVAELMQGPPLAERAQTFFATLAAEANRPHCGEVVRGIYNGLVQRATEQGLYQPKE